MFAATFCKRDTFDISSYGILLPFSVVYQKYPYKTYDKGRESGRNSTDVPL